MSYGPSGTRKPNSRKELPNHGKQPTVGWEIRKWPLKDIPESSLFKEKSISCFGGFTFEAKAQENESTNREMGNFSKGKGDLN